MDVLIDFLAHDNDQQTRFAGLPCLEVPFVSSLSSFQHAGPQEPNLARIYRLESPKNLGVHFFGAPFVPTSQFWLLDRSLLTDRSLWAYLPHGKAEKERKITIG